MIPEGFTPEEVMQAHQYLYYVKSAPVWRDWQYDQFCMEHGLEGVGGSDCEEHYSERIKQLAKLFLHK